MNGNALVDAMLEKTGFTTDTALAKKLGVTRQTLYLVRREEQGFSPELAKKIAILLDEDPGNILMWMNAWTAKDKGTRDYWLKAAAGMVSAVIISLGSLPADSKQDSNLPSYTLCELIRIWIVDRFQLFTRVSYS